MNYNRSKFHVRILMRAILYIICLVYVNLTFSQSVKFSESYYLKAP